MSPAAELAAAWGYCVFLVLAGTALDHAGRRGRADATWPETDRRLFYRGIARVLWLLALLVLAVAAARSP